MTLSPEVQLLINDLLVWIGFGTVIGLAARALMPGRDPAGATTTVLLGVGGSVLGCGLVGFFRDGDRIMPTSPLGMVVAVAGALTLLGLYRYYGDLLPWPMPDSRQASSSRHGSYDFRRPQYGSATYED